MICATLYALESLKYNPEKYSDIGLGWLLMSFIEFVFIASMLVILTTIYLKITGA